MLILSVAELNSRISSLFINSNYSRDRQASELVNCLDVLDHYKRAIKHYHPAVLLRTAVYSIYLSIYLSISHRVSVSVAALAHQSLPQTMRSSRVLWTEKMILVL
jgi:hypothetical protein